MFFSLIVELPHHEQCRWTLLGRKHLLRGHRSQILSSRWPGTQWVLRRITWRCVFSVGIDYKNPQCLKTSITSPRDTCTIAAVWEETDTVQVKWNMLPRMESYPVRSLRWQIYSQPSQILLFLNVFLDVFVMTGNTRAEALHWFQGFVGLQCLWWLGIEISIYPAFSIYFFPRHTAEPLWILIDFPRSKMSLLQQAVYIRYTEKQDR